MVHNVTHRTTSLCRKRGWALCGAVALVFLFTASAGKSQIPEEKVQLLSGAPMLMAADAQGITTIVGKNINVPEGPPGNARAKKLKDVGIGIGPSSENEPTVVGSPTDKKKLVAGSHRYPTATTPFHCVAFYSVNGGATWSDPIPMPGLTPTSDFSDPVLAYAPDGSRVYYAYMDIKGDDYDIVVSYSDDDGQTWTGPFIALDANLGVFTYDKPWIGTSIDGSQSNWVYVTATRFDLTGANPDYIAFVRSGDKGITWSASPVLIDANVPAYPPMVVQGSRPTGGAGGDVLVAYYHSGSDGWLTGSFEIRTAYSSDNGATFSPPVTAVVDNYELPYWLGPLASYHRWWGGMFPDVEIDARGGAHIIYTHDPVENVPYPGAYSLTPEDGDIRYIYSAGSPYDTWSAPVTVNDDGTERAQGYAALKIGNGGQAHAIWEDHRGSSEDNLYYDMFYSRKTPDLLTGWFRNFRVNEATSINDYVFIGDYNDLSANATTLFGIWTDRRHQTSIFSSEDNVFGTKIVAGGGLGKEGLGTEADLPGAFALYANYPNPFNPETEIRFQIPEEMQVVLKVYDMLGQEIQTLADAPFAAGYHSVRWNGTDGNGRGVTSGVYFYRLQAGSYSDVKKMTLLR